MDVATQKAYHKDCNTREKDPYTEAPFSKIKYKTIVGRILPCDSEPEKQKGRKPARWNPK